MSARLHMRQVDVVLVARALRRGTAACIKVSHARTRARVHTRARARARARAHERERAARRRTHTLALTAPSTMRARAAGRRLRACAENAFVEATPISGLRRRQRARSVRRGGEGFHETRCESGLRPVEPAVPRKYVNLLVSLASRL
eukprot:4513808-Pleurochrysis_carterae.AAC.1